MITHLPASITHPLPLAHRLRRWLAGTLRTLQPALQASIARTQANRWRQHFSAEAHTWLLLFHGFSHSPSLRQSYARLAGYPDLLRASGLARADGRDGLAVSYSQVAASNTTRPAAWLAGLLTQVLRQLRQQGVTRRLACPLDLQVVDATFLRLSLRLGGWLPHTHASDVPGVRVHVRYAPSWDLPEQVLISTTRLHEGSALDQHLADPAWCAQMAGRTLLLDLGYYSHRRVVAVQAAGIHWITRQHPTARLTVVAELPLQQRLPGLAAGRIQVLHDQRVQVGSPENHQSVVLCGVRLVTAQVQASPAAAPVIYTILTDRWDLTAAEVVQAYCWRWQIELFFRWLKSHLHLRYLLGSSRNAVELTIWLTLLVHLLTVWAAAALGQARGPVLVALLGDALAQVAPADVTPAESQSLVQLRLPWTEFPAPDSS